MTNTPSSSDNRAARRARARRHRRPYGTQAATVLAVATAALASGIALAPSAHAEPLQGGVTGDSTQDGVTGGTRQGGTTTAPAPETTPEPDTSSVPDVPAVGGGRATYSAGLTRFSVNGLTLWGKSGDRHGFNNGMGATRDLRRRLVFSVNTLRMGQDQPATAGRIIAAALSARPQQP